MFAGVINRQVVFCCHPVVVLGPSGVAASFDNEEDALRFVIGRGPPLGTVYRHNGSKWDMPKVDPGETYQRLFGQEPKRRPQKPP